MSGVIERGHRLGFAIESRDAIGIAGVPSGRTLIATCRLSLVSWAR